MNEITKKYVAHIIRYMESHKLTQRDASNRIGVSQQTK